MTEQVASASYTGSVPSAIGTALHNTVEDEVLLKVTEPVGVVEELLPPDTTAVKVTTSAGFAGVVSVVVDGSDSPMTETDPDPTLVTYASAPDGLTATRTGELPTVIVAATVLLDSAIWDTVPEVVLST